MALALGPRMEDGGGHNIGPQSTAHVQQQSLVTANYSVDPRLPELRALGNPATMMGVPDEKTLHVEGNMFFFSVKGDVEFSQGATTAFSGRGFTSFNGLDTHGLTQREFERRLRCHGVTGGQKYFTQDMADSNAVAVHLRGSTTMFNYSRETFYPGDLVGWRAPSVDEAERQREVAERPDHPETPNRKQLLAIPKRVTYEDLVDEFGATARTLISLNLSAPDAMNIPLFRERMRMRKNPPIDHDQVAVLLKQWVMSTAYHTCMAMVHAGVLKPSWELVTSGGQTDDADVAGRPATNETDYNNWIGRLMAGERGGHAGTANWEAEVLQVDQQTGAPTFVAQESAGSQDAVRAGNRELSEVLSSLLGLSEDSARPHLQEWTALTQHVLVRSLQGSVKQPELAEDIQRLVAADFGKAPERRVNRYGHAKADLTISAQVQDVSASASDSLARSIGAMINSNFEHVVGTCSNYSKPKSAIQLVIGAG